MAYDTFITRCAAVLLVRESIQGFPLAHGDRHSSYAEAEYAENFFQERFGTEPSHQAAADSGYITLGASWVVWHRITGVAHWRPKKLFFLNDALKEIRFF